MDKNLNFRIKDLSVEIEGKNKELVRMEEVRRHQEDVSEAKYKEVGGSRWGTAVGGRTCRRIKFSFDAVRSGANVTYLHCLLQDLQLHTRVPRLHLSD